MKKIIYLIIVFMSLFFVACSTEDISQQAIDEFNQLDSKGDIVLVEDSKILYFKNSTLYLENLVMTKGEILNGGYIVTKDKIYYTTTLEVYMFNFTFVVYQCDIDGKNITKLFEAKELKTNPKAVANNMKFYYEYYTKDALDDSSRQIDCYDIENNTNITIATGENCILSDYYVRNISNYQVTLKNKPYFEFVKDKSYFEITNKETKETKIIDQSFIENTVYYELLQKYNYSTKKIEVNENHIYITYTIETGSVDKHPFVIFEYDFNNNTIEYKQISMLDYGIDYKVIYLK